ncbi:MAG: T9SS type A sorting domain-containing protein [Bacteroidales bacterium]|nr:T9SS type A sorting domain-containing protein [Bacteroidales bacterium]
MNCKRKLVYAALALFIFAQAKAQISFGGMPRFIETKSQSNSIVTLSKINNNTLFEEDINLTGKGSAMRVGVMQDAKYNNKTDGSTITLDNGDRIWTLTIKSEDATFMSVAFKKFDIPAGAELYVYDATKEFVIGKFTYESVLPNGDFYTQSIPGDQITLEYYEPKEVAGMGVIETEQVCHGYKEIFEMMNHQKGYYGNSEGNCHINVACEEGDSWRNQIRSVAAYEIIAGGYSYMCSGALINNTNNDKTHYLLSAYHCQDLNNITRFVFYFNYQTNTCTGNSGTYNNTIIGADIVAKNSASDFLLFKLKQNIPDNFKVYYSGWSRNTTTPTVGAGIHHPGGDWKKISIPASISSGDANLWEVNWISGANNKGVTEGGSSGSPLFNADGLIVGQLYAGVSACNLINYPNQLYDYYGKFSRSWIGGGSATTRLRDWLDPVGSNVTQLNGINWDYSGDSVGINTSIEQNTMSVYPNPSNGVLYVDINEIGQGEYTIYDMMGRRIQNSKMMLTSATYQLKTDYLKEGTYILEIIVNGKKYNKTIVVK